MGVIPIIDPAVLREAAEYRAGLRKGGIELPDWNPLEWSVTLAVKVGQVGLAAMRTAKPEDTGDDAQGGAIEYRTLLVHVIATAADALEKFEASQK